MNFFIVFASVVVFALASATLDSAVAQTSAPKKALAKNLPPKSKRGQKAKTNVEAPTEPPATAPADESIADDDTPETISQKRGASVDSNSAIRLNYGRADWNRNPEAVDSATVYLREGATGRLVQIEVEETAPSSAIFSGLYSINWRNIEALKVEFYTPPQGLLGTLVGRQKITKMIDSKELRRLPFVLRKDPKTGLQNIELFDSADQARLAYKAFQSEQELLLAMKNKVAERDQTVDTAKLAMEKAELEEAARNMAERVRMSQLETQRLAGLVTAFGVLPQKERDRRKAEAQKAADQAQIDFRANRFAEAKAGYDKAIELDPTNRGYYYFYGITLYRLGEFNRALVYLDLSYGPMVKPAERDYYRALCYYSIKDSTSALAAFDNVIKSKDDLAGSAYFYKGVVHYERKNWADARSSFQAVLDNSKDAALDQQAETYIEYILRIQQVEAERAKHWTLSGTLGLMYDDNVLSTSDTDRDRGTATNLPAYRALLQGTARYRAIYEETRELAVQLDAMTMTSVGEDLQATQTLANADPTVVGVTVPWTHKGTFRGKGHKFDFIPGYEITNMSVENNEWKTINSSLLMNFQNLFVMSETWFTNLNVDLRYDTSLLQSSTGDNDATALKSKLTWSNINFPFSDKKQIVMSDLAYTMNSALGKNTVFNRVDMGLGYVRPAFYDMTFVSKLSYFILTYPENATGRVDNSYTLMLGLSRPVGAKLNAGLTGLYNINSSNVAANQYKKTTILLTLGYSDAF